MRTCFGTTLATRLAAYDGTSCPPTVQLACSSGGCQDQTILTFPAVQNQNYLLRVGSRMVGDSGSGTFSIVEDPCPSIPDDGLEDNDDCPSAVPITSGSFPGLFVSKSDPDWYAFNLNPGGTVMIDVLFSHAAGDIDIYLRGECGGSDLVTGGSGDDNESIMYTNNTGACQALRLRVEHWFPDNNADCNNYSMTISGVGGCTVSTCTSYCASLPNATGMAAELSCSGSPNSSLVLTSTPVPDTTGQFFYGPMMLAGGSNLGDGLRCVGGATTRLLPFINAGMMMQLPNTASIALNYTAPYAAGLTGTKYFQHWFRSGLATGAGSNTSDALEITF